MGIMLETLQAGAQAWGLALSDVQLERFDRYAEMLIEVNKVMNLTAVTEPAEVAVRHMLDSVCPAALDLIPQGAKIIDVGTGAGFPGLPLAILREDLTVTLSDSLNKRVNFLQDVVKALGMEDRVTCVWSRAEDLGKNKAHREQYDVAVARAVAALPVLSEYMLPMVKVGGRMLAWKGERAEAECAEAREAIGLLGGSRVLVAPYTLYHMDSALNLVRIEKTRPTPPRFPRKAGTPQKQPLGVKTK